MTEDEMREAAKRAFAKKIPVARDYAQFDAAMRTALRIAIPWVRQQTLREAAEAANDEACGACRAYNYFGERILALIPARPSQTEPRHDPA